jgi:hypothetical protein
MGPHCSFPSGNVPHCFGVQQLDVAALQLDPALQLHWMVPPQLSLSLPQLPAG